MRRTLALAEKTSDTSAWVKRADDAKKEMELALDEEKAQIAKLPFTEAELQAALDVLKKKTEDDQAKAARKEEAARSRGSGSKAPAAKPAKPAKEEP